MSSSRQRTATNNEPVQDPADIVAAMNTMAAAMRDTAAATNRAIEQLMQQNVDGSRNNRRANNDDHDEGAPEGNRPMTLAYFLKVNPPSFNGSTEATRATDWIRDIEKSMQAQQVPVRQYDEFATYMLKEDAQSWWQGAEQMLGPGGAEITWINFKREFLNKYFPRAVRTAKELELAQLKQGAMTIADYTRKFEELCRFSRICRGDPEDVEE